MCCGKDGKKKVKVGQILLVIGLGCIIKKMNFIKPPIYLEAFMFLLRVKFYKFTYYIKENE